MEFIIITVYISIFMATMNIIIEGKMGDPATLNIALLTSGYRVIDSWCPTIKFKLGHCYSSNPPLLTVQILRISLGPTRCRVASHSRSSPKAGTLLVVSK